MNFSSVKGRFDIHSLFPNKKLIGAEIGVEWGEYSEYLLSTGFFEKFFSIDDWNTEFYDTLDNHNRPLTLDKENPAYLYTLKRLGKFNESTVIREKSSMAVNLFDDNYFDFIYIDSNHTYENVIKDLESWWPKLKDGGMFCGDDYYNGNHGVDWAGKQYTCYFDVKKAVDNFSKIVKKTVNLIPKLENKNKYPNWVIIK